MDSSEFLLCVNKIYNQALHGRRLVVTGDSFFISVAEKQFISKLSNSETNDVMLATYKPALNAHFASGGQILIVDFYSNGRGLHHLQFLDDLHEIVIFESYEDSAKSLIDEYIIPVALNFSKVEFTVMEP